MQFYKYIGLMCLIVSIDMGAISHRKPKPQISTNNQQQIDGQESSVSGQEPMERLSKLVESLGGAHSIDEQATQNPEETLTDITYLLSEREINANSKDKSGFTALMYAAYINCFSLTNIFLSQEDVDILAQDDQGKTALSYARDNKAKLAKCSDEQGKYAASINKGIIDMLEKAVNKQRLLNAQLEEERSMEAAKKQKGK